MSVPVEVEELIASMRAQIAAPQGEVAELRRRPAVRHLPRVTYGVSLASESA